MEPIYEERHPKYDEEEFAAQWAMENLTTSLEECDLKLNSINHETMVVSMEVRNLREAVDRGFASVVKAIWDASGKRPADADTYKLPEKGGE